MCLMFALANGGGPASLLKIRCQMALGRKHTHTHISEAKRLRTPVEASFLIGSDCMWMTLLSSSHLALTERGAMIKL